MKLTWINLMYLAGGCLIIALGISFFDKPSNFSEFGIVGKIFTVLFAICFAGGILVYLFNLIKGKKK